MGSSVWRGFARRLAFRDGFGRRLFLFTAVAFILLAALENATQDRLIDRRYNALPLTLTVFTDTVMPRGEVIRHIRPVFTTPYGRTPEFSDHVLPEHDRWSWQFTDLTRNIEIDVSPGYEERITELRLSVGGKDVPVTLSEPQNADRDGAAVLRHRVVLPESEIRRSVLAPKVGFVNWPGDLTILKRIGAFVGLWGGILALLIFAARSSLFASFRERHLPGLCDDHHADQGPAQAYSRLWFWCGLGVVLSTLAVLQWRDPFYFTQDDNFSQFLPVMLAGGQSLFSGLLFDYNPYQLLGAPTVEVGTYALTYPGTYIAYALARLAGNENLTLEIFCMGHLVPGFAATFWAARRWGAGGALAAALGVCFVLSGYALVVGRSWYYMTPIFLWLPLALAALHGVIFRDRKTGDTVLLALSLGLLFHAGNAQMWVYAAALTGGLALLLWWNRDFPARVFTHLSAAGLATLALVAPLLLPQFGFAAQAIRRGGGGYDIAHSITSVFLPLPLELTDMNFRTAPAFVLDLGPALYSGPLLVAGLLAAAVFAAAWLRGRTAGQALPAPGLIALAGAAAFLLACGFKGPLWFAHTALPVLEKFTHPIKFLPFAVFFLGLAAILAWERLKLPGRIKGRAAAVFAVGAFGLMFWNAMRTHENAFHYFPDDPYPGVERPLTVPRVHTERLFPMTPLRSFYRGFTQSQNLNFAMLHGELSLWGYDPIIWTHPHFDTTLTKLVRDPLPLFREFGVGRLIVWQEVSAVLPQIFSTDSLRSWQADIAALVRAGGVDLPELNGDRRLRGEVRVPGAKPLAYLAGDPSRAWPVIVAGPRVTVVFGEEGWPGGELVLSFLRFGRSAVMADGQSVSHRADEFGRIVAEVPAGTRKVELGYRINWAPGLAVALALLGLAAYAVWRFDGPGRREQGQP